MDDILMMISCAVYGCTNNTATNPDPAIQYYYFPKHSGISQWIAACWRADPIDINTARICSIHFDENSYTSEYKVDYLGNYSRCSKILKYDAIPTLYLPNPQTPVIIKTTIEPSITLSTKPISTTQEIKQIVLYEVENVSEQANFLEIQPPQQPVLSSDIKMDIEDSTVHVNPLTIVEPIKLETNTAALQNDDWKYKHITNTQELRNLERENNANRQKLETLEALVKNMEKEVNEKNQMLQNQEEDIRKLMDQRDLLQRSTMSIMEQKNILSEVFSESQIKILSGKKKIYWSNDDMAIGYTIRHLSNKRCYMYLTKNLNIPLPALSSIKRWSTLKKNEYMAESKKVMDGIKFEDEDSS